MVCISFLPRLSAFATAMRIQQELIQGILEPFTVLAGASENLLGSTAHGVEGAITGMTNLAPRVCLKAFELARAGRYDEARVWAVEISRAEWALIRGNVVGTKVHPRCTPIVVACRPEP